MLQAKMSKALILSPTLSMQADCSPFLKLSYSFRICSVLSIRLQRMEPYVPGCSRGVSNSR
jgi:hypothetical protein